MANLRMQLGDVNIAQFEGKYITPPLPSVYLFNIKKAEAKPNKEKTGTMLELECEIAATVEGQEYVGKSFGMFMGIATTNAANARGVEFGRQQLARIVAAIGLNPADFGTDDMVGLSFIAALTKNDKSDFPNVARILTQDGWELVDLFSNAKRPTFDREPELGEKLAQLLAQFGGAAPQPQVPQMATPQQAMAAPAAPQPTAGFPPAAPANNPAAAFPPAATGQATTAMGGFPPPPAPTAAPATGQPAGFPPMGFPPQG